MIGTKALDGYVCRTKKKKEKLATNATAGRYPNEVNPVLYFERANEERLCFAPAAAACMT